MIYFSQFLILPKMLPWFKKSFEQFQDSNWHYQRRADEKIYEYSVDHIQEQLKMQKKDKLNRTIQDLGFKEEIDYNGKIVLKNNIEIKRNITFGETENMISRLNSRGNKQNSKRSQK